MESVVESHGLLSPAASALSSSAGGSHGEQGLPTARSHPLKPGGKKEIALINYVDDKILRITRRYGKKFSDSNAVQDDAPGYTSFDQVVEDVEAVFEVVWISGTRKLEILPAKKDCSLPDQGMYQVCWRLPVCSDPTPKFIYPSSPVCYSIMSRGADFLCSAAIQTPYLLSLAGLLCSYMPAFPFSLSTFHLLKRLDQAFASLLRDHGNIDSVDSQRNLQHVSKTEEVRIKSLIEDTRVVAVQTATNSGHIAQIQDILSNEETEPDDSPADGTTDLQEYDDISIGISKIYKQTMEILGDSLV
jgi:Subunit 11 of the general transcription factor TFIIH